MLAAPPTRAPDPRQGAPGLRSKVTNRLEVAALIRRFLDGSAGKWEWDDFISVRQRDEHIEAIRQAILEIETNFPRDTPNKWCSDAGMLKLQALASALVSDQN
jgi:hypothetical protein